MEGKQPANEIHDTFVAWATARGVRIKDIAPANIAGRGVGIVATANIKVSTPPQTQSAVPTTTLQAGTELVHVPTKALLTTNSIPARFADQHGPISAHGLIAAFLTSAAKSGADEEYGPWMATWPAWDHFAATMPMLWPEELFRATTVSARDRRLAWPVPCGIGAFNGQWAYTTPLARLTVASAPLIVKQQKKLDADFAAAREATPRLDERAYTHMWLIVNTRSFYWDLPLRHQPQGAEDRMALCPFVDYFNHADVGCVVQYNRNGYTVAADRDYEAGEELFVCYGAHNGDLMFAEYGFVPQPNCFDAVSLDAFVLSPLTDIDDKHGPRLKKAGYLDNYSVVAVDSGAEICHRTQVAARTVTMRPTEWLDFVQDGRSSAEQDKQALEYIRLNIIGPFKEIAERSIRILDDDNHAVWQKPWWITEEWDAPRADIKRTLRMRWQQIHSMLAAAIE